MGTVVSFAVRPGGLDDGGLRDALTAACRVLHQADAVFSTWDPGSPVSRLRRGELLVARAPAAVAEVIALCETAREASAGWFDPWALPGGFDPTGLVKGWAIDGALATLGWAGAAAALVNGGGDLAAFGSPGTGPSAAPGQPSPPWRAGIQHPWRPGALAAVVEVHGAVATSGSYQRGPHLIDPHTGQPSRSAASATVTGPVLGLADALATALAVGGDAALAAVAALPGYEGYLIRPDGSEAATPGLPFFTSAGMGRTGTASREDFEAGSSPL
jgi:FAD:protein FMN transferase